MKSARKILIVGALILSALVGAQNTQAQTVAQLGQQMGLHFTTTDSDANLYYQIRNETIKLHELDLNGLIYSADDDKQIAQYEFTVNQPIAAGNVFWLMLFGNANACTGISWKIYNSKDEVISETFNSYRAVDNFFVVQSQEDFTESIKAGKYKLKIMYNDRNAETLYFSVASSSQAFLDNVKKALNDGRPPQTVINGLTWISLDGFYNKIGRYNGKTGTWNFTVDQLTILCFVPQKVWCLPCEGSKKALTEIAEDFKDKINLYFVDTETEKILCDFFGAKKVPYTIFFNFDDDPKADMGFGGEQEKTWREYINAALLEKTGSATTQTSDSTSM